MGESVLIDASRRFALRSEIVASLDGDGQGHSVIKDRMTQQRGLFIASVAEHNEEVSQALDSITEQGIGVSLVTSDEREIESDGLLPSTDCGVVYVRGEKRQLEPRMYVTVGMIASMGRGLEPLFGEGEGTANPTQRLEAAVTAASWFTLGKWVVDTIDPRFVRDVDTSVAALRAVSVFTGIEADRLDIESQEEEIDNSLLILSYRMAGAMAYKGLARYLSSQELYAKSSLPIFQRMISGMYDMQAQEDPAHITPLKFAMAKPLYAAEVAKVFEYLGPVAKELQDQNRLITLEY